MAIVVAFKSNSEKPDCYGLSLFLKEKIEQELVEILDESKSSGILRQAMEYSLLNQGKRIRPLLSLMHAYDFIGYEKWLVKISCSLELLHTSTLIHDDLPAIDNDDFRRGKPSCHKKFNPATAILAGNCLVAEAFRSISPDNRLVSVLATTYSIINNGQQLDLIEDERKKNLSLIHQQKTGELFAAACTFSALAAKKDQEQVELSRKLGTLLGLAFQIADDFIDCYGSYEDRGRHESSDQKNQRLNFFTDHSRDAKKTVE